MDFRGIDYYQKEFQEIKKSGNYFYQQLTTAKSFHGFVKDILYKKDYHNNSCKYLFHYTNDGFNLFFGQFLENNDFIPLSTKFKSVQISYWLDYKIGDKRLITTDIKLLNQKDSEFQTFINSLIKHLYTQKPIHGQTLNLIYLISIFEKSYNSLDIDKLISQLHNLESQTSETNKFKIYLDMISNLEWGFNTYHRFKRSEGTIYSRSTFLKSKNPYINHLIAKESKIGSRDLDISDPHVKDYLGRKYDEQNDLNAAKILLYEKFNLFHYFISSIRDYEKIPFGEIKLDYKKKPK